MLQFELDFLNSVFVNDLQRALAGNLLDGRTQIFRTVIKSVGVTVKTVDCLTIELMT